MSCIAGTYDMVIDQGATLSRALTWKNSARVPYNLTGFTARMHVRNTVTDTGTVLIRTTSNGGILLGGATGVVTVKLTATESAAIPAGRYVYDLELVSAGGEVSRLVEGSFIVRPEVTR
jgi:hypothetical protein